MTYLPLCQEIQVKVKHVKAAKNIELRNQMLEEQKDLEAQPNEAVVAMFRNMARSYAEHIVKNGSRKTSKKAS